MSRLTLTPALSRKRERERAAPEVRVGDRPAALLPLAGEGGAKRRMRVSPTVDHSLELSLLKGRRRSSR